MTSTHVLSTGRGFPTRWAAPLLSWHLWVFLTVAVLILLPLSLLILGSFSTANLPSDFSFSNLSFENYAEVWLAPDTYGVFANTLNYVIGAVCFGFSIAVVLAWLVERTDLPFTFLIYIGIPMTLAMPGMLQAMAYVLMFSPNIGFVNAFLVWLLGLEAAPFNVYSIGGMAFVEGLRLVPTAFLMMVPLLRGMDPALEEAAAMSGAGPVSTVRKVTIQLMLPGLVAVFIYQVMTALEVFEVPAILGMPAGIYVFSTKIYVLLHSDTFIPDYGNANALAILYLVVAVGATLIYMRVIRHGERYGVITGKGYRPKTMKLGLWRWPAFGLVAFFLCFSIIMPFCVFLYVSLLPFFQSTSLVGFETLTLRHYFELGEVDLIGQILLNTIYMTFAVGTLTVILSFFISWIVIRTKFAGRKVLDMLAFIPHAIPGIVMGLAFLWVFQLVNDAGVPIYGSIWSIAIAFSIGFIAYGTRSLNAALLQVHKDLEEAAQTSGASQWRTMWKIFVPLMMPAFVGLWIWAVLHAIRIAGLPLILYEGTDNQVLAILVWHQWNEGYLESVAAIGTLLILFLFVVTLLLRLGGFGRAVKVQK
jgi:iron(III) transport system permease protein